MEEEYKIGDPVEIIQDWGSVRKGLQTTIRKLTADNNTKDYINIFLEYSPSGPNSGNRDGGYNVPIQILKKLNKEPQVINDYSIF